MPSTASISIAFRRSPDVLDPNTAGYTAGLEAAQNFGLTVEEGEAVFHRVFYPTNVNFNYAGTMGPDDAFRFGTFPGLMDQGPLSPVAVQDWLGLPLTFSALRLIMVEIKPIIPGYGVKASGTLTSTNVELADGATVTIGSTTYRFKDTMAAAYDVKRHGTTADTTLSNLIAAINGSGTPGTEYYAGTAAHPDVTAGTLTAHAIPITAIAEGDPGNLIATTETSSVLSWGAITLTGGAWYTSPATLRPLEGTVLVEIDQELLPNGTGSSSAFKAIFESPAMFALATREAWTPDTTGRITFRFTTTLPSPATDADVNAVVTLILIGTP